MGNKNENRVKLVKLMLLLQTVNSYGDLGNFDSTNKKVDELIDELMVEKESIDKKMKKEAK